MRGLRTLALAAALAAGASGLAFAQDPVSAAIGTAGNIAGAAKAIASARCSGFGLFKSGSRLVEFLWRM